MIVSIFNTSTGAEIREEDLYCIECCNENVLFVRSIARFEIYSCTICQSRIDLVLGDNEGAYLTERLASEHTLKDGFYI